MATQPAVIDFLAWLDAHSNLELAGQVVVTGSLYLVGEARRALVT
jgi:folylpolyglutamate synthase/dihydropteroate synthase